MVLGNSRAALVLNEVKKSVIGKDECIIKVLAAILAGGHILIEDIPGVGKTTLAMAFSKAMNLTCRRVQFTPDVLPADINGFSLYQKQTGKFVYQPGTIMCNLFLADEINRTSPKTQSALLEVMEEGRVSVDGVSHNVPSPFVVIATQNPSGSAGTALLPESQLDRFIIRISMGYPDIKQEISIVKGKSGGSSISDIQPVINEQELLEMKEEASGVYIQEPIYRYMAEIVKATREHPAIALGVSPRGTISLAKMAKSYAYLNGRSYALPEDIDPILEDVLLHRIQLQPRARIGQTDTCLLLSDLVKKIKRPSVRKE